VRRTTPAGIVAPGLQAPRLLAAPVVLATVTLTIAALLTFTHRNDLRSSWLRT
jgi:hypothetical protein